MKRLTKRARLRLAVRVAARNAQDARRELDQAAARFSSAREARKRTEAHLLLVISDAEKAGAL